MTAADNVRHLPTSPVAQALTLAQAYQPGYLDRLLADEARKEPTPDDVITRTVDELAAAGQAVWLRRDAEARAEQATRWAVILEQQLGEIDRVAEQWTRLHDPMRAAMGRLLLDITRGHRGDPDGGDVA